MKTTKSVSQGNQAQSRDSNPGFPEYEAGLHLTGINVRIF